MSIKKLPAACHLIQKVTHSLPLGIYVNTYFRPPRMETVNDFFHAVPPLPPAPVFNNSTSHVTKYGDHTTSGLCGARGEAWRAGRYGENQVWR